MKGVIMGFDISKITNAALKALAMKIDGSNENGVVKNNTLDNGYEISIFRAQAASIIEKDEAAKQEFNEIVNEEIKGNFNSYGEIVGAFYPELIKKHGFIKAMRMFKEAAGIDLRAHVQEDKVKIPYEIDGITRKDEGFGLLEESKHNKFRTDRILYEKLKEWDKVNEEQKQVDKKIANMSVEEYNKLRGNEILNDTEIRDSKNDKNLDEENNK